MNMVTKIVTYLHNSEDKSRIDFMIQMSKYRKVLHLVQR